MASRISRRFLRVLLVAATLFYSSARTSRSSEDDIPVDSDIPEAMLPPIINNPVLLRIRKGISFLPDRGQLDGVLSRKIEDINRACNLTNSEKKKLRLAGHEDIKRFLGRTHQLEAALRSLSGPLQIDEVAREWDSLLRQSILGIFEEGSFFSKTRRQMLKAEQAVKLEGEPAATIARSDDDFDEQAQVPKLPMPRGAGVVDVVLFGSSDPDTIASARRRLDAILTSKLDSLDQFCELKRAQRHKLYLAGQGDINRFFDLADEQKARFQHITVDPVQDRMNRNDWILVQQIRQEINPLQAVLHSGPFGDRSLFSKCLKTTLTVDQAAKYEAISDVQRVGGRIKVRAVGVDDAMEINLTGTPFTDDGLARLRCVTNVRFLILDATQVTDAGLAHLEGMKDLEVLDLGRTQVSSAGLVHLKGLTNLQRLDLRCTHVTDAGLAHLNGLTMLNHLYLYGTKITDSGMAHLGSMKRLESVYLGRSQVSDAGIVDLTGLAELKELTLNDTQVTDAGLVQLTAVRSIQLLDLRNTRITDTGLAALRSLTNLRDLFVDGTRVTAAGIARTQQDLPGLTVDDSPRRKSGDLNK
jgi:hypothetical protein